KGPVKPRYVFNNLAASFTLHTGDKVPWVFYDLAFEVPRDFKFFRSRLQAGRKLMTFQWEKRKLYLWYFSLADQLLRKHDSIGEAMAVFLNTFPELKGPDFRYENG